MKPIDQLLKWVQGESIHNDERDECCPDFSCCNSEMNTTKEVREQFIEAFLNDDKEQQHRLLMMFLGQSFTCNPETKDKKVHITG